MYLRESWRETRDTDVLAEEVKFRDVPPHCSFRRELRKVSFSTWTKEV
jgi:hypothetical protein